MAALSGRGAGFLSAGPRSEALHFWSAIPVSCVRAAVRTATIGRAAGAGLDRDVTAGDVAGGGGAGELLARARIAVVGAAGGAGRGGIAGLLRAHHEVAAGVAAVGVGVRRAAGGAAAVAREAGGHPVVKAVARAPLDGAADQVDGTGVGVVAGVGARAREAGRDAAR